MHKEEYLLTKLGIVSEWDKIYLSPFHPILVAYALEYDSQYDTKEDSRFAKKLLSPFYLLPYIFVNNSAGNGGTVDLYYKDCTVRDCIFINNTGNYTIQNGWNYPYNIIVSGNIFLNNNPTEDIIHFDNPENFELYKAIITPKNKYELKQYIKYVSTYGNE